MTTSEMIHQAIRAHALLEFDYHGEHRIAAPYCYGVTPRGLNALRAVQLRRRNSTSKSGGFGFGKLWHEAEMEKVSVMSESFVPDDPNYNPNDSAFAQVLCRI
jgi:hypothetical protein